LLTGPPADAGRELPRCLELSWIEASIRAVEDNGVAARVDHDHGKRLSDGTHALPVKHVVSCRTEAACVQVARWSRGAGLTPSAVRTEHGHGGVAYYQVDLRQRVPLVGRRVQAEALRVHVALSGFPDARYDTWMLDTDPEGRRDGR